MNTWAPCSPGGEKKIVCCAWSCGAKPMFAYSLIWMNRKVQPSRNVVSMPAFRPKRLPRLIDCSAQWIVNDEDTRIAVLTPATSTGSVVPGAGHGSPCAMRMKKYAVKKAPKTITSEMMKRSIPSSCGSARELTLAGGGPWWSWSPCAAGWAMLAASIVTRLGGRRGRGGLQVDDHVLDGRRGHVLDALDQVRAQPAGALVGERRDDDIIDAEQLEGVDRGGVGVG